jgi:alpha-L-arabinofuranosidase
MKKAALTIHADQLKFPVSPLLYGLFFEEINHAGDGGLYAELVRNRSFEDTIVPDRCHVEHNCLHTPAGWESPFPAEPGSIPGWSLVHDVGSHGEMALDERNPLSETHPLSLRVRSNPSGGGGVAVVNEGYWGIPVWNGGKYRLSFYARKEDSFSGRLSASLESRDGKSVYAAQNIVIESDTWQKVELTLESHAEDAEAVLAISTKDSGEFNLELVSLFPEATWRNQKNGLRPDLVGMLEGLKPKFLRFPGGCFVEGFSLETAYRWKKTLGDYTERSSHWTLWHYRTTNGLGYHEYLQFAEDMGMEMMFVVNCGLTCQGRPGELVPLDELDEWVQDMLDAVEYANGPADSKWGAIRARNGHPEPFGLKYIEIGNENFGPEYNVRYRIFYEALKEKYPEIITIFNTHWEVGTETAGLPVEIVDEHFYPDAEFNLLYHDMYGSYDRQGPKIYVGEYAQTVDNQDGTLGGALSEAAFMTGIERNQDLVVMSSYAPLFANVRHTVWKPNLIYFNGTSVYGTPSYYVQKLFGENRGDQVVAADLQTETYAPIIEGGVTIPQPMWDKVKEFQVYRGGEQVYNAKLITGSEQGGTLVDDTVQVGDRSWKNYDIHFKVRPGSEGIRLRFLDRHLKWDRQNYFQWELGESGQSKLVHIVGWSRVKPVPSQDLAGPADAWLDAKVVVREEGIRCYINGSLIHEHTFGRIPYLTSVTTLDQAQQQLIVKLVNPSACEIETHLQLEGTEVRAQGEQIILTSGSPKDFNTMELPTNVSPVTLPFEAEGSSFTYAMKPYSLVILKLPIQ